MVFIPLVYNSGDQNVLINDWYACLQVLSKQLTVWNAYLSLLGYNLVIAPVFPLNRPRTGIEIQLPGILCMMQLILRTEIPAAFSLWSVFSSHAHTG